MARSLNRVQLIGNLTRDPELRYTPSGTAVCTFGMATNRTWTTDTGEKREEADFHKIVAWNKLAEICSQFLSKGRKAYVEGRLSTRNWTGQDGQQRSTTEVVIDDMILLDNRGGQTGRAVGAVGPEGAGKTPPAAEQASEQTSSEKSGNDTAVEKRKKTQTKIEEDQKEETRVATTGNTADEVVPEDIPF